MDVAGLHLAADGRAQQVYRQSGQVYISPLKVSVHCRADAETAIRQPGQLCCQRFYFGHLEQQSQVRTLCVQDRGDGGCGRIDLLRAEITLDCGAQGAQGEIGKRNRCRVQVHLERGGQLRRGLAAGYVSASDHGIDIQGRYGEALRIRGVGNDAGQGHRRVQRRPVALAAKTQIDIDRFAVFQLCGRHIEIGDLVAHRFLPIIQGNSGVLDSDATQGNCG